MRTKHKVLVAFVTFNDFSYEGHEVKVLSDGNAKSAAIYIEEARNLAKNKLPSHMVPNVWIPLTQMPSNSNDKIDKRFLAILFEQLDSQLLRELERSDNSDIVQPQNQEEVLIQEIWAEVLNVPQKSIGSNHSFRGLGGDSILAIQVSSICRRHNLLLSVHNMLQNHTISQLAELARINSAQQLGTDERVEGSIPLSPNQHMFLKFEQDNINHFNQSWLLTVQEPISLDILNSSIQTLVENHDILRSRFSCTDNQWSLRVLSPKEMTFKVHHSQIHSVEELKCDIHQLQRNLDLISGPLFQFSLYDMPNGQQLIFMAVHHFIIDLLSWKIIWEDLEQLLQGKDSCYKSASFMQWSQVLYDHAQTLDLSSWPKQPTTQPVSSDFDLLAKNLQDTTRSLSFRLDTFFTKLANRYCEQSTGADIVDLLVSSLAHSYCSSFEQDSLSVTLESHGREFESSSIDTSRTVGWFTNLYPIVIAAEKDDPIIDAIRQTISQHRQIRGNESVYGLLKYLNKKTAPLFEKDPPQVTLAYMPNTLNPGSSRSNSSSFLQPIPPDSKYKFDLEGVSPKWKRHQVFNCMAHFVGEQLEATIVYSDAMYAESQIQCWLDSWQNALIDAIMSISKESSFTHEDNLSLYSTTLGGDIFAPSPLDSNGTIGTIQGCDSEETVDDCLTLISNSSKETMFIVHCATGIASYFESLRKYMRHTLYSISDPSLGTYKSFDSIEMAAAKYLKANREVQHEGPYYLHGYSFGGLVAFEIARQLESQGHEVARLTIIDTLAPHTKRQLKISTDSNSSQEYLNLISTCGGWNLDKLASQMMLEKIENNRQLMKKYQPPIKKLAADIVLVKAVADNVDNQESQVCYGWSQYAAKVIVHDVEAEHHQLMFEPHVSKIAEYLQ
ncbi:hypothetical protein K7432_014633 [Basidiobolus ranarum]|uniref:Carrier domain-containing protein n=1 Tax=Basidiobolus ranarum TaxID=34480 RepID=A0ABR2WH91_9FUNG